MGHIDWIEIADLPDALKDGREVLLWVSHGFPAVYKWRGRFWWNMEDVALNMAWPTHFAEINTPEGQHGGV